MDSPGSLKIIHHYAGHIIPILLTVTLLPQLQISLHLHKKRNISQSCIYYMLTASNIQLATVLLRIFTIPGNKHSCIMLKVTSFRVVLGLLPLAKVFQCCLGIVRYCRTILISNTQKAGISIIHHTTHYKCHHQIEGEENNFHYLFIMYHDQFHNNNIN